MDISSLPSQMDNIQEIYNALNSQAKTIVKEYTKDIDVLIKQVNECINDLSNDEIRRIELKLSLMAYDLGDLKDSTNMASEIAEILQNEAQANAYNTATGTSEQRKNSAILSIGKEAATAKLYKLVASQIKTKLDETHRIVDTLKSILISRASDRKLTDNYEGNSVQYDENTGEIKGE